MSSMHRTDFILLVVVFFAVSVFTFSYTSSFVGPEITGNVFLRLSKEFYYGAQLLAPWPQPTVLLPVTFHKQEHALSCEIAALKMALDYRSIFVSVSELFSNLIYSHTGPRESGNIWGDPDLGFVGNIDSKMPNGGYGVYEKPIELVAEK